MHRILHPPRAVTKVSLAGRNLQFHTPNKHALGRVISKFGSDPDCNRWLSQITADDVLWDIGANVGTVSIYGSVLSGCRVFAFEPGAANYAALNRNIEMNGLSDRIVAYCLAIADHNSVDKFFMPGTEAGGALSSYGSATDYRGLPFTPRFVQGAVAMSIDFLAETLPFPNYIKIDVDGIEEAVLRGGDATFRDARLKSIRVEGDKNRPELLERFKALLPGMHLSGVAAGGVVLNYTFSR